MVSELMVNLVEIEEGPSSSLLLAVFFSSVTGVSMFPRASVAKSRGFSLLMRFVRSTWPRGLPRASVEPETSMVI